MSVNLNNIKNKVLRLTCPIHFKHPEIIVLGSELKFNCCCEQFQQKCLTASKKAFEDEAERVIAESLGKAFKNFR